MRAISWLFIAACVSGCQTFSSSKTASGWYALDHAREVDCKTWPLRESDLSLDEVAAVQGLHPGFLITGTKRDATPFHYYAPFEGEIKMDGSSFAPLSLGLGSVFLGAAALGGQDVAVTAHNLPQKVALELRTVRGNVVKYAGELADFNIVEGSVTQSDAGFWLTLQGDDNAYHLAFVSVTKGSKVSVHLFKDLSLATSPKILPQTGKKAALLVWRDGDGSKPLQARTVREDGNVEAAVTLDLPLGQLESWTALNYSGGTYIAMIDGDTLIGQAEVKVAFVYASDMGLAVKWTAASPLKDIHATEPVLYVSDRGLELLLLNWIDEESTIARYMIAAGSLGKPSYTGIFPKGTRIMAAFREDGGEDSYLLLRNKTETRWLYRLCEFKDP